MPVGEQYAEKSFQVSVDATEKVVLEIDPARYTTREFSDWDGYIAIKAQGADVNYRLVKVVGEIEVEASTGTVSDGASTLIVLDDTVRYRLYLSASAAATAVVGYRISYYY